MGFCSFSTGAIANNKIELDSLFVSEFLPYAPDGAVKVYVYGLSLCSRPESYDNTLEHFASVLSLSEQDVISCFIYWQEQGLVQMLSSMPLQVRYIPLQSYFTNTKKFNKDKYSSFNAEAQELIKKRMITPNEYSEYYGLIEFNHIEPTALIMIIAYCVSLKGENVGYSYILTVAKNWAADGIFTAAQVEERLKEYENQTDDIKQLFKILGIKRNPTAAEHELYIKWTEKLDYENGILFQIAKDRKKKFNTLSFEILDGIIMKYYEQKLFSIKEILEYENSKETLKNTAKAVNRGLGLYYESLDMVIDNYISVWANYGFDEKTLVLVASYCFKCSIRTLDGMNSVIQKLYKLGIVSEDAISKYISSLSKADGEIKEVLNTLSLSRNVNAFDREYFKTWKEDWKISDELLSYAASLTASKGAGMPYLNKILSSWHAEKVDTIEKAQKKSNETKDSSPSSSAVKGHSYSKEELSALFDSLDEIEI